jgi:hypothetical protein
MRCATLWNVLEGRNGVSIEMVVWHALMLPTGEPSLPVNEFVGDHRRAHGISLFTSGSLHYSTSH